jgi:N-acetylglutamate synthase-like GNAT family acetyltransferase
VRPYKIKMIPIRPAQAEDQKAIERIIHDAGINPMSLDWHRFVIAEEDADPKGFAKPFGSIIGIGQIKPHGDGSRELASIAVIPSRRGQGIGSEIIRALLAQEQGTLYLTCREQLEAYYTRFGFRRVPRDEMTPYFRRIVRVVNIFSPLMRGVRIIVMKRDGE